LLVIGFPKPLISNWLLVTDDWWHSRET